MPLVKGIQQRIGAEKLEVLMLSVDLEYGMPKEEVLQGNSKVLNKRGVAWTNILLPNGFRDTQERFNLDGYGLALIGPDGIVRGIDLRGDDLEAAVRSTGLTNSAKD